MSFSEYSEYDAFGLRALIGAREVSISEVAVAAFERIAQLNPLLNAIVDTFDDLVDQQVKVLSCNRDAEHFPLLGVPVVVKDCVAGVCGVSQKFGTRLTRAFTAERDEEIIRRYRQAGAVFIGQTNVPEFSSSITTESVLYGVCSNPWDLTRTVGGSSGGAACSVAACMAPVATANDSAGSIRIPASCTGVFGFKPSRGRTPNGPDVSEIWNGLFVQHVLTRSVRDSAVFLDVAHGSDDGAPYAAPHFEGTYLAEAGKDPERLKIAFSLQPINGVPVEDACKAVVLDTAELLSDLGHTIVEDQPALEAGRYFEVLENLICVNLAYEFQRHAMHQNTEISAETVEACHLKMIRIGEQLPATALMEFYTLKAHCERQMGRFFKTYDAFLTPTLAKAPVSHGFLNANSSNLRAYLDRFWAFSPFTTLANISGAPSMSVPLFHNSEGVPIGSMLTAAFGRDEKLFSLAGQLERALPWKGRKPPLDTFLGGVETSCAQ
ncbi:MAG: amidase [Pseudomonadota bacterium]